MNISDELLAKARNCKSATELMLLAKENGIELTEEKAGNFFGKYGEKIISDEELGNVAGGSCSTQIVRHEKQYFARKEDVQYIAEIGQTIWLYAILFGDVWQAKVLERYPKQIDGRWVDAYRAYWDDFTFGKSGEFFRDNIVCNL